MVEKLNRIKVEEKLKSAGLLMFTPREFGGMFGVSPKTASMFISRNVKSGLFIKLRANHYLLKDSSPSLHFIANRLYQPSYVSLESALSYYGMIPEVVYTITSLTTKPTREFVTPRGTFSYQRIKKAVFTGYHPMLIDGRRVLFAEPEKALADYLYFIDLKRTLPNERLSLKNVRKKKLMQLARLFKRSSLVRLIERVYAEQRKPRNIY